MGKLTLRQREDAADRLGTISCIFIVISVQQSEHKKRSDQNEKRNDSEKKQLFSVFHGVPSFFSITIMTAEKDRIPVARYRMI